MVLSKLPPPQTLADVYVAPPILKLAALSTYPTLGDIVRTLVPPETELL